MDSPARTKGYGLVRRGWEERGREWKECGERVGTLWEDYAEGVGRVWREYGESVGP